MIQTTPVSGGMGMHLLQKMGWKPGEGLGKEKNGSLQPLLLEVKLDKKGLVAEEEVKLTDLNTFFVTKLMVVFFSYRILKRERHKRQRRPDQLHYKWQSKISKANIQFHCLVN